MNIAKIRARSLEYAKGNFAQPPRKRIIRESAEQDWYDLMLALDFLADVARAKHKSRLAVADNEIAFRARYLAHINSAEWKDFRVRIFVERGRTCEYCGTTPRVVNLHHLTYVRLGHELPKDVKVACVPCHEKQHGGKFTRKREQ